MSETSGAKDGQKSGKSSASAAAKAPKDSKSGLSAALAGMSVGAGAAATSAPAASAAASAASVEESKATSGSSEGEGESDVTPDVSDTSIRHPLHNTWTMYYSAPQQGRAKGDAKAWSNNVKKIIDFSFVEDFWSLFNNLQPPSSLQNKCDYYLFKDDIRPEWEDKNNAKGGRWVIEFERRDKDLLNRSWTYTVLAMIGEQFEDNEEICGAVVSIRPKKNKVQLWTRTASDADAQKRIGASFKKFIESNTKISYQAHNDQGEKSAHETPSRYEA